MIVCNWNCNLFRWEWNYWWSRKPVVGYVEEGNTALHKTSPSWADELFWYHRLQCCLSGFTILEHSSCLLQVSSTILFTYFRPESQPVPCSICVFTKRKPLDYSQTKQRWCTTTSFCHFFAVQILFLCPHSCFDAICSNIDSLSRQVQPVPSHSICTIIDCARTPGWVSYRVIIRVQKLLGATSEP